MLGDQGGDQQRDQAASWAAADSPMPSGMVSHARTAATVRHGPWAICSVRPKKTSAARKMATPPASSSAPASGQPLGAAPVASSARGLDGDDPEQDRQVPVAEGVQGWSWLGRRANGAVQRLLGADVVVAAEER